MKVESADKKILVELIKNARQSISQIARKTKLTREIVKYRIDKLEKRISALVKSKSKK